MTTPVFAAMWFSPLQATRRIAAHPRWIAPFLLVAGFCVAVFLFSTSNDIQKVLDRLPASATPADKDIVRQQLSADVLSESLFLPFRLLTGWASFALLLYALCRAFVPPQPPRYVQLFSLEVHAELILAVGAAAGACGWLDFLSLRGVLPSANFTVQSLLTSLNIFTLWYVWVLTAGISALCSFRRRTSFLLASAAWAASLVFNLGLLRLFQTVLHLRL